MTYDELKYLRRDKEGLISLSRFTYCWEPMFCEPKRKHGDEADPSDEVTVIH